MSRHIHFSPGDEYVQLSQGLELRGQTEPHAQAHGQGRMELQNLADFHLLLLLPLSFRDSELRKILGIVSSQRLKLQ